MPLSQCHSDTFTEIQQTDKEWQEVEMEGGRDEEEKKREKGWDRERREEINRENGWRDGKV